MKISIIAAIGSNRELGKNNKLLWHIPEDLKRFKKLTQGHAVIMGRKTFASIGKPLPNRKNIVITRNKNWSPEGCLIANSLEDAIKLASQGDALRGKVFEVFIIGGGQIYEQAMKYVDKLYLTIIEGNFEADTFFPDYSQFKKIISKQIGQSSGYHYTWIELEK